MTKKYSQKEKILSVMIRAMDPDKWWKAEEFSDKKLNDLWVREPNQIVSELGGNYPEMIEMKQDGKYKLIRFRFNNTAHFLHKVSSRIAEVIKSEMKELNLEYYGRKPEYRMDRERNVAVPIPFIKLPNPRAEQKTLL